MAMKKYDTEELQFAHEVLKMLVDLDPNRWDEWFAKNIQPADSFAVIVEKIERRITDLEGKKYGVLYRVDAEGLRRELLQACEGDPELDTVLRIFHAQRIPAAEGVLE